MRENEKGRNGEKEEEEEMGEKEKGRNGEKEEEEMGEKEKGEERSTGENMFEGVLEKSGDYRIRVYMMRSAARRNEVANYRLEMIISALDQGTGNHDALVDGTNYNATGKVPCQTTAGQPTGNCDFGVVRQGNGSAQVTITKPDGRTRTIYFENGSATGYDMSQADPKEFNSSKEVDLFIIRIGEERYEIPEAVVFGG